MAFKDLKTSFCRGSNMKSTIFNQIVTREFFQCRIRRFAWESESDCKVVVDRIVELWAWDIYKDLPISLLNAQQIMKQRQIFWQSMRSYCLSHKSASGARQLGQDCKAHRAIVQKSTKQMLLLLLLLLLLLFFFFLSPGGGGGGRDRG